MRIVIFSKNSELGGAKKEEVAVARQKLMGVAP